MNNTDQPKSVGLGGDGDEICAIQDVEREFDVSLNYDDAQNWETAGDVFNSLLAAIPGEVSNHDDVWDRFTAALCETTGVDPTVITPDSPLLGPSIWAKLVDWSVTIWMIVLGLALTAFAFAQT